MIHPMVGFRHDIQSIIIENKECVNRNILKTNSIKKSLALSCHLRMRLLRDVLVLLCQVNDKLEILFWFIYNFFNRSSTMFTKYRQPSELTSFNLLRCCDEKNHSQMLFYEQYQMQRSSNIRLTQNNTIIQNDEEQPPFPSHKLPINQRIKRKDRQTNKTNQASSFNTAQLHRNSESDAYRKDENILAYQLGVCIKDRKKTSLKHKKRISDNRPFLDLSNHHKWQQVKKPTKMTLNLIQNRLKGITLKLGQNLPTVRSQFNNTNQCTERSQL